MTKKVRIWRTPGRAMSILLCNVLKSPMSRTRIFQKIVEIPRDQVTVQKLLHAGDRLLEGGEACGGGAIEDDADHDQRPEADGRRVQVRSDRGHIPLLEKTLGPPVTGCGADVHRPGDLGVGEPPVPLQKAQDVAVDPVEAGRGRVFHKTAHYRRYRQMNRRPLPENTKHAPLICKHLSRICRYGAPHICKGARPCPCWKNSTVTP